MHIKKAQLYNFRNYQQNAWEFADGLNILFGKNGQGKTNFLEAISFAAYAASHKNAAEDDLIRLSANEMSVSFLLGKNGDSESKIVIKKSGRKAKKEILVNDCQVKPRELIGEMKLVVFAPEDMQIVKSEPAFRRRFLDLQLAQLSGAYCFSLARYNKILQQRNKLLASIEGVPDYGLLEAWDGQLAKEAALIVAMRCQKTARLSELAGKFYQAISGAEDELSCLYRRRDNSGHSLLSALPDGDTELWYKNELKSRLAKDLEKGYTGIGPHRDDIFFLLNELPARGFASQGQQRSLVLALKMAEVAMVKEECGEYPILLLDDVLSELDATRRKNLLLFLDGKLQTFVTVTDKDIYPYFPQAAFYEVADGNIYPAARQTDAWR
jgi:DNA replication and repair protein RecF